MHSSTRLLLLPFWLLLWFLVGCGPRSNAGSDLYSVGFGTEVELDGSGSRGRTFKWRQVSGPPVSLATPDKAKTRFRTRPIEEVVPLSDHPSPVAIPPTSIYTFALEVTGLSGKTASDEISVHSASVQPGTGGVPLDADAYFNGGLGSAWKWRLAAKPEGSRAQMVDENSRTPHFRPDVKGGYEIVEERSGYNNYLFAGRFDDVPKDCGRSDCHPKEEAAWKHTKHANVDRKQPECVRCHTVGFDPGAKNGGFDEPCATDQALCESNKQVLGVVHCLSCHGPGFRSAANYAEGACAQCHDLPPRYTKVTEWRKAKMSRLTAGLEPAVQSSTPGCPDCHSAQGFLRAQKGDAGRPLGPMYAAPIGCPVCHNPHSAEHPHQLRIYGNVTTRSGLKLEKIGAAALCATCHNAGLPRDAAVAQRRPPHAPQIDVLVAAGAIHQTRPDLCVDCHVRKQHGGGGHSFVPRLGTPEIRQIQDEIAQLLANAKQTLSVRARSYKSCDGKQAGAHVEARGERLIVTTTEGHDLGDCDRNGKIEGSETSYVLPQTPEGHRLAEDAYDVFLIEKDGSHGYHNPAFAKQTLERVLAARPPAK